jgi:hypothetical protein
LIVREVNSTLPTAVSIYGIAEETVGLAKGKHIRPNLTVETPGLSEALQA